MSGWFAIKRGALDHDLFAPKGPYSKFEAWVWMVENTPFKDGEVEVKGKIYPTKRGHLYHSIRFMAGKFRWSEKAVRVFIDALVERGALEKIGAQRGAQFGAQLKLCNYDKYQSTGHSKGHSEGHKEEQGKQLPLTGTENSVDPASIIFGLGVNLLTASGIPERESRSILGKWRRDHDEGQLVAAIMRCQREGAVSPVEFIPGCLKWQKKRKEPEYGDTRIRKSDGQKMVYMAGHTGWVPEYA